LPGSVARQVQRANGSQVEVRAPKYGSERVVFIADDLVTVLSAHVAAYPVGPDGWLFPGPTGDPPHQNTPATGGAKRCATRACRASSSTTCGTSSPAA
jgi:integrase